jgi:cell division protein FtsL
MFKVILFTLLITLLLLTIGILYQTLKIHKLEAQMKRIRIRKNTFEKFDKLYQEIDNIINLN